MVIRAGILGVSEGNGHPFSFSAIVNGFDAAQFATAGWPVILDYLKREPPERFGIEGVKVTHAWTQDEAITARLCAASRIETACAKPADMLGSVDAVIVARDDWESHAELAAPFLERGLAVFVDKPLTLAASELARFEPYLRQGKLMSCAALRYARELDGIRDDLRQGRLGAPRLVVAAVLNGLEKYGIHMLEAAAGLGFGVPVSVTRIEAPHEAFAMRFPGEAALALHCLGPVGKTFHLSLFGEKGQRHADLNDTFSAFRRTLERFFAMVRDGKPPIEPDETLALMELLAAARALQPGETARLRRRAHAAA